MSRIKAVRAVKQIVADLSGRKGIGDEWEQIDPTIQREIIAAWIDLVHGRPYGRKRQFTPEQILAIRNDARSDPQIAAEYGSNRSTIGNIKRGLVYADVGGPIRTDKLGNPRKFTSEQIIGIREDGRVYSEIAADFNAYASEIYRIKRGLTYADVDGPIGARERGRRAGISPQRRSPRAEYAHAKG